MNGTITFISAAIPRSLRQKYLPAHYVIGEMANDVDVLMFSPQEYELAKIYLPQEPQQVHRMKLSAREPNPRNHARSSFLRLWNVEKKAA